MRRLPTVLVTDVVRSSRLGDSHGGVYLVDLETGETRKVIDWNDPSIDWSGRGGERGLRGIAIRDETIFIAAANEILAYDRRFRHIGSYMSRYLADCHEITIDGDRLLAASTGHDCVLELDIPSGRFVDATLVRWRLDPATGEPDLRSGRHPLNVRRFDPQAENGPHRADTTHVNMAYREDGVTYVCGVNLTYVLAIEGNKFRLEGRVPGWTHNARPWRDGIVFNSTDEDRVCFATREGIIRASVPVPKYDDTTLEVKDVPTDVARQGFGRGLIPWDGDPDRPGLLIGGSSPSTVNVYDIDRGEIVRTVNFGRDIRNAPHGLAIWPFDD